MAATEMRREPLPPPSPPPHPNRLSTDAPPAPPLRRQHAALPPPPAACRPGVGCAPQEGEVGGSEVVRAENRPAGRGDAGAGHDLP